MAPQRQHLSASISAVDLGAIQVALDAQPGAQRDHGIPVRLQQVARRNIAVRDKASIASWLEQISSASSRARYGTLLGPFVSSGNHYVLAI
jgi:hypothetical protein